MSFTRTEKISLARKLDGRRRLLPDNPFYSKKWKVSDALLISIYLSYINSIKLNKSSSKSESRSYL
jgi:hypothetical protein